MSLNTFLARQLRQPSGWFGSLLLSRMMNATNRRIVERTLELLAIEPQHHVLELGFGGGAALALLTKRIRGGAICGVDVSPGMVRRAERQFRKEIAKGTMQVRQGDVCGVPYGSEVFDRVLTVNTIYFWSDTMRGLGEIRRVLKAGGRAAVAIRSKQAMSKAQFTQHGFQLFSPDDLAAAMQQVGFRELKVEHSDHDKLYDQVIVVGSR